MGDETMGMLVALTEHGLGNNETASVAAAMKEEPAAASVAPVAAAVEEKPAAASAAPVSAAQTQNSCAR